MNKPPCNSPQLETAALGTSSDNRSVSLSVPYAYAIVTDRIVTGEVSTDSAL